jgi:hypothetical protein
VDTREPPSQEALEKSTEVDLYYSLLTRVPKTRVNKTKRRIPGIDLRDYSGNIQGTIREQSWNIKEALR